ncbi:GGDEF domain-containing protein [Butyrivibrio fibrisolvens]|uniref:GGDEF domain-containing protein n=1 Tax=Butyrivibrio fibrisolvens TaxID=831 RepID=UPI0011B21E92|nr:GGDEF domain-containing protein [Butyrivibrio fibrisolvens]
MAYSKSYLRNEWDNDNFIEIVFTVTSLVAASFEIFGIEDDVLDNTILVSAVFTHVYTYIMYTNRDPLTFLLNRQAYYEYVRANEKKITGVISVDMNELKGINDTLGHAEGDKALVQIGTVLKKTRSHGTLIYRMGGDEFTVICTDSDKNDIEKIVKNIEHEMNKTPYTCSIGYACQDAGKLWMSLIAKRISECMIINKNIMTHMIE